MSHELQELLNCPTGSRKKHWAEAHLATPIQDLVVCRANAMEGLWELHLVLDAVV